MVFLTAMAAILLAQYLGKAGVVYGFIIAISMEVANLLIMTKSAKKAEDLVSEKYRKVIRGYKIREKEFEEAAESVKRSNEALEKQLQEYIDKINGLEIKLRDKEKTVAEQRETLGQQQKVLDAMAKPAWE